MFPLTHTPVFFSFAIFNLKKILAYNLFISLFLLTSNLMSFSTIRYYKENGNYFFLKKMKNKNKINIEYNLLIMPYISIFFLLI